MSTPRNRQPSGQPVGGQFAETTRGPSGLSLEYAEADDAERAAEQLFNEAALRDRNDGDGDRWEDANDKVKAQYRHLAAKQAGPYWVDLESVPHGADPVDVANQIRHESAERDLSEKVAERDGWGADEHQLFNEESASLDLELLREAGFDGTMEPDSHSSEYRTFTDARDGWQYRVGLSRMVSVSTSSDVGDGYFHMMQTGSPYSSNSPARIRDQMETVRYARAVDESLQKWRKSDALPGGPVPESAEIVIDDEHPAANDKAHVTVSGDSGEKTVFVFDDENDTAYVFNEDDEYMSWTETNRRLAAASLDIDAGGANDVVGRVKTLRTLAISSARHKMPGTS